MLWLPNLAYKTYVQTSGWRKNSHFCERPTLSDHMVQSANPIMPRKFDKLIEREINRKNVRSSQYPFFASCYLLLLVQYTMLDKNSTHRDGSGWPGGNLVDMSEFSSFISCSLSRFCTAFKIACLFSWSFLSSTKNWSIGVRLYTIYNLGGKWKALNKPRIDTFVCSLL